MKLKAVTMACAFALAGGAVSGCVDTGPHHGGFYGSGPVVRVDRDMHHDRFHRDAMRHDDRRDGRRHDDRRFDRDRHDDHRYGDRSPSESHRIDCRRDWRNPACHGHH